MGYSEGNTFEKIMDRALSDDLLVNVDKRMGSIIYDALAPMAMELANVYAMLDIMDEQSSVLTATGSNLDRRAYDYGLARYPATYALRIASFKKYKTDAQGRPELDEHGEKILVDMVVPDGSRFAVPSDSSITYIYDGIRQSMPIVRCEQAGSAGNEPMGTLLPLTPIPGLAVAEIVGTLTPAEDTESDEELRERIKAKVSYEAFGGNIPDYIEKVNAIEGVGETKVFPAWRNNGSVLLSIVDGNREPVTNEFISTVKEIVDPDAVTGSGQGTAPIGHYVTVTTPVRFTVNVTIDLTVEGNDLDSVYTRVVTVVGDYITEVRKQWKQDAVLSILRARIIERLLSQIPEILNVTEVLLNGEDEDITLTDEARLDGQKLPYVGEVTLV